MRGLSAERVEDGKWAVLAETLPTLEARVETNKSKSWRKPKGEKVRLAVGSPLINLGYNW